VGVFAIKGFFTANAKANMQILIDAFFSAGILFVLFSGLLFVSGEGALLGVSYVFGRAIKAVFVPFGRKDHETYAQYRERKLGTKKSGIGTPIFLTGLLFVVVSLIFLIIWYQL
jgi:hypothetical protein